MSVLDLALELASTGLPVFPCGANKRPAIRKNEDGRGFHDATTDPAAIRSLFARRNAALVAVPTGEWSGFDALDLDYRHGAGDWERANQSRIPETRIHQTRSGGRHLLFAHAPGVRISESVIAPGVDVRGSGGYVIWWPAHGVSVASDAPIAPWPNWLLPLALPKPPPQRASAGPSSREPVASEHLDKIINYALARVNTASDGQKHHTLRAMARLLGGIQDRAGFSDAKAAEWLLDALPSTVKDWRGAAKTADWGLENGRGIPLTLHEKPNSKEPDPRRKETARMAFRLLRGGVAGAGVLAVLDQQNAQRTEPLPDQVIRETALWAARQMKGQSNAAR